MKRACNRTIIVSVALFVALVTFSAPTKAYYGDGCEQYGIMAYSIGGYCKCTAGYVFATDVLGNKTCTDANLVCHDKYGYGSEYNYSSESCRCSYGYVLGTDAIGRTSCISEDDACQNQLGYNSRSTYGGQCECSYGYVISGGQCVDGNSFCHSRNGYNSSYNNSSNSCECDNGYILDDSKQCVEKQNNVYFKLLDVDTDNREAIVKSEYDYRKYLITYGTGCYSSSINRYKSRDLVINLGTDYDLDTYDSIVLQEDNETCYVTHRERTYDDVLVSGDDAATYYAPSPTAVKTTYTAPSVVIPSKSSASVKTQQDSQTEIKKPFPNSVTISPKATSSVNANATAPNSNQTSTSTSPKKSLWEKFFSWFKWWIT